MSSFDSIAGKVIPEGLPAATIEQVPDALFWVDREARIHFVNAAACEMHGYSTEEFSRLSVFDLTGEYDDANRLAWDRMWERLEAEKTFLLESHHLRRDGTRFPVEALIFLVRGAEKDFCGCFIRDISQRKEAEAALKKAYAEVNELKKRLIADNQYLREEIGGDDSGDIVTGDPAFEAVIEQARRVAPTATTVLVTGETGTGKELLARLIHGSSPRRDRPMIKVNCATIPANLVESELFGHEKGAFSGATSQRRGRFELADGGTIFLDEVGELPLELQPKLLRVLQEGQYERVGGSETRNTDARVIAATNRNLGEEIEAGRFREDLFYRLNVFPLALPPLRERQGDIGPLVDHFIGKHAPRTGSPVRHCSRGSLAKLQAYPWPGNVRELENIVERALILSTGDSLDVSAALPSEAKTPEATQSPDSSGSGKTGKGDENPVSLAEMERRAIAGALKSCAWVIEGPRGAARRLGMAPSTLRDRMRRYDLRQH